MNVYDDGQGAADDSAYDGVPHAARPWLHRWVEAGVLDAAQVARIGAFERVHPQPARPSATTPPLMSAAIEALIYVGGAVIVAAISVVMAGYWDELGLAGQVAVPAAGTVIALAGGFLVPRRWADAGVRMRAALWITAAATFFALVTIVVSRAGWESESQMLAVAAAVTVLTGALWLAHRAAPQHLAAFVAVSMLSVSIWNAVIGFDSDGSLGSGAAIVLVGLAWAMLAWRRALPGCGRWAPPTVFDRPSGDHAADDAERALRQRRWGLGLGAGGATLGAVIMAASWTAPWLGLLPLVVLLAAGVVVGDLLVLIIAAVGAVIALPLVTSHYLQSTIATALVLLAVGAAMVALAILVARRQARRQRAASSVIPG